MLGRQGLLKGMFNIEILNLLSFHRVLPKGDSMTGDKVVTHITESELTMFVLLSEQPISLNICMKLAKECF